MSEQWSADINVVSGALKLWFRELPEPLLTFHLYHQFIEAARTLPADPDVSPRLMWTRV